MNTAFVFPGQGSQKVGMGKALWERSPEAREIFDKADAALGMNLSELCFEGPEEELRLTANTQPAILTVSIAALRALESSGIRPDVVAGHSLGEYSALVAAGSLDFADAVTAVRRRGQFMQEAVPPGEGGMAALLGLGDDVVEEICRQASESGVCSPANLNSPGQIVIAGHRAAVERAVLLSKEKGVKRAVMLAVSAPFHCELMRPAALRLEPFLNDIEFRDLQVPLVTNAEASMIESGAEARRCLIAQMDSPVRWSESIKLLVDRGVKTFVEVGPGKVLSGLIRQISRESRLLHVEDSQSLDASLAALER